MGIVEVNGVRGLASDISKELQRSAVMHIVLRRTTSTDSPESCSFAAVSPAGEDASCANVERAAGQQASNVNSWRENVARVKMSEYITLLAHREMVAIYQGLLQSEQALKQSQELF